MILAAAAAITIFNIYVMGQFFKIRSDGQKVNFWKFWEIL